MTTETQATIEELNYDLEINQVPLSLDPTDHRYRADSGIEIRTREPMPNETFLRAGYIPLEGRSFNYRDRTHESGVSCFRYLDGEQDTAAVFFGYSDAEAFWISGGVLQMKRDGEWVDMLGSDREPLLSDPFYIARLGLTD